MLEAQVEACEARKLWETGMVFETTPKLMRTPNSQIDELEVAIFG